MTEKLKSWWSEDGKWFCILVDDGVNKATVSLTPEEAANLDFSIRVRAIATDAVTAQTTAPEKA